MRDDIKEYNAVEQVAHKFCEAVKAGKDPLNGIINFCAN